MCDWEKVRITCGTRNCSLPLLLFSQPQQVIVSELRYAFLGTTRGAICMLRPILLLRLQSCNPKSDESPGAPAHWIRRSAALYDLERESRFSAEAL